ncbi:MAG: hydroxymethylpyrimidine/phosphomethylpyrimidine kinase [Bacteroidales bacterium]|nr:hydroxymethylpyrimidine/phosphomethylpyrimidine kinase [Bacteroidales bacterium]
MKYFLTIAASDSSGGAGIQQDIRIAERLGFHALSVITAITAQNFRAVENVYSLNSEIVQRQLDALIKQFDISVCKIGVLTSAEHIDIVAKFLKNLNNSVKIIDPVFTSSSGWNFLDVSLLEYYKNQLLPLVDVLTPNKTELELLTAKSAHDLKAAVDLAVQIHEKYKCNIYLKGGHFDLFSNYIKEALVTESHVLYFTKRRYNFAYNHGTGCAFSTALACYLGRGFALSEAVRKATHLVSKMYKDINKKGYF